MGKKQRLPRKLKKMLKKLDGIFDVFVTSEGYRIHYKPFREFNETNTIYPLLPKDCYERKK